MARGPGERDYRDGRKKGEKEPERPAENPERRWWTLKGQPCSDSIRDTVTRLTQAQQYRLRQAVVSSRLYGNLSLQGNAGAAYARLLAAQSASKDRMTFNAIQSIVDTLVSHVGETKPRPFYLTSGGNYRQQRKAKKLSQFSDGVFYETKTYRKGPKCFRDGTIWGDGFMHVFTRGGKLHHERVLGSELWIDEVEAQHGNPRNMHRQKTVDRDELAAYFPEKRAEIMKVSRAQEAAADNLSDMVTVVESWHLGAESESGELLGGLRSICLPAAGVMLVEPEEWEYDFFPFARIPWCERPVGYWSQGLCEQLQGEQIELNKELWIIQRSLHLAGTLKVLVPNGSKIVKESFNNEIGAIINFAGDKPPQFYCPEPIHQLYFENPNRIIERMYRKAGVSELSASSKKPVGLNAGIALREYKDSEQERHKTAGEAYDDFYLQLANMDRCLARELKGYKVRVPGKQTFREIDFTKDIGKFKDEEFILQCFPVSQLPRDPAGRMQTIQEWVQAGWITPRAARRAMDFPDLDTIESLANAQEDLLTKVLDDIIDDGHYAPPEPTDDLQLAKEMVLEYIQRYRLLDLEGEKMDMLRTFNSQVETLIKRTLPPAPAAGIPQAAAQPPPTSELIPNAPGIQRAA
jgi:hypothetical protein